eukprot:1157356-Pelagomonas_calceolata.AAC.8
MKGGRAPHRGSLFSCLCSYLLANSGASLIAKVLLAWMAHLSPWRPPSPSAPSGSWASAWACGQLPACSVVWLQRMRSLWSAARLWVWERHLLCPLPRPSLSAHSLDSLPAPFGLPGFCQQTEVRAGKLNGKEAAVVLEKKRRGRSFAADSPPF